MGDFVSAILSKITALAAWFGSLFVAVFDAIWNVIKDAFVFVLDSLMGLATGALGAMDVSGITTSLSAWGSLPSSVLNILALLGLGQAIAIITTAIGIRLVLQLIPFVRLGS